MPARRIATTTFLALFVAVAAAAIGVRRPTQGSTDADR